MEQRVLRSRRLRVVQDNGPRGFFVIDRAGRPSERSRFSGLRGPNDYNTIVIFREYVPLGLAVVALLLAIAQSVHPFGFRVHPALLLMVAFLLGLRHVMRRQRRNREQILKSVPPQPLGLNDEPDQRTNE